MAGHLIALYLSEHNYSVDILCRKVFNLSSKITTIVWDGSFATLANLVTSEYEVIINCIGLLNKACDKDPKTAMKINSFLPLFIASKIKPETKFIHLSTDCVFSGNNAPYCESYIPDGEDIYDISKATGELMSGPNIIILRNSIIGPDINEKGIGLFNWFMHQHGSINGYDNWIWSGITTLELAKQIMGFIENDIYGLFHLTNNKSISKYHLLKIFNKVFNQNVYIEKAYLKNCINKTLTNSIDDFLVPSYEQMVVDMKEWISNHKELYWYE